MSPRMQPDGMVKMTNVGTVENPIIVAAPNTPAEAMIEFARSLGVSGEAARNFAQAYIQTVSSAREELLWRLNERLQGRDPGEPSNWRGLRA